MEGDGFHLHREPDVRASENRLQRYTAHCAKLDHNYSKTKLNNSIQDFEVYMNFDEDVVSDDDKMEVKGENTSYYLNTKEDDFQLNMELVVKRPIKGCERFQDLWSNISHVNVKRKRKNMEKDKQGNSNLDKEVKAVAVSDYNMGKEDSRNINYHSNMKEHGFRLKKVSHKFQDLRSNVSYVYTKRHRSNTDNKGNVSHVNLKRYRNITDSVNKGKEEGRNIYTHVNSKVDRIRYKNGCTKFQDLGSNVSHVYAKRYRHKTDSRKKEEGKTIYRHVNSKVDGVPFKNWRPKFQDLGPNVTHVYAKRYRHTKEQGEEGNSYLDKDIEVKVVPNDAMEKVVGGNNTSHLNAKEDGCDDEKMCQKYPDLRSNVSHVNIKRYRHNTEQVYSNLDKNDKVKGLSDDDMGKEDTGNIYFHLNSDEEGVDPYVESKVRRPNKLKGCQAIYVGPKVSHVNGKSYRDKTDRDINLNASNEGLSTTDETIEEGEGSDKNISIPWKCCVCQKTFSNCFEYSNHAEIESVTMASQCTICYFYFENGIALENHLRQNCCNKLSGSSCEDYIVEANKGLKYHFPKARKNMNEWITSKPILINTARYIFMKFFKCKMCSKVICQCCNNQENGFGLAKYDDFSKQSKCSAQGSTATAHGVGKVTINNSKCGPKSEASGNPSLKCSQCLKNFDNLNEWVYHSENHPEQKPFRCILCKALFTRYVRFKAHRTTGVIHKGAINDSKQYTCPTCDVNVDTARELLKHYEIHMDLRPYKCSFCQSTFPNPEVLRDHKMNCHSGLFSHFERCHICNVNLPKQRQYHILHMTEHYEGACFICKKQIPKQFDLKHHVASHFGITQCRLCNTSFLTKSLLERHHRLCTAGLFTCEICKDLFPDVETLKCHQITHKTKEESPSLKVIQPTIKFLCEICGAVCLTNKSLRKHNLSHASN